MFYEILTTSAFCTDENCSGFKRKCTKISNKNCLCLIRFTIEGSDDAPNWLMPTGWAVLLKLFLAIIAEQAKPLQLPSSTTQMSSSASMPLLPSTISMSSTRKPTPVSSVQLEPVPRSLHSHWHFVHPHTTPLFPLKLAIHPPATYHRVSNPPLRAQPNLIPQTHLSHPNPLRILTSPYPRANIFIVASYT